MERKYFAAYNKDDTIRMKSSSGGIFYELARYTINQNGVVFGAVWNKNWLVDITYAETLEEVEPMMTSKYVLANIKDSYKDCKKFLDAGRLVLYTALPCQIHGLKNYLKKEYNNLICVDIACHGTMSVQIWKDYLETIQKPDNPIVSINMRDKEHGWTNYQFLVKYKDGTEYKCRGRDNKYMQVFLSDAYLRPCCYDCKFKMDNSISDIIIGDYWGIHKFHSGINEGNKGISLVMTNIKGETILKQCNIELVESKEEYARTTGDGVNSKIRTDRIKPYIKDEVFK